MNPISSLLCLLVFYGSAQAALAPIHQNPKDLAVMIAFVQQHPAVMQSLKSIHLDTFSVRFGNECVARFGRVSASTIPGPAPQLEYKSSNCALSNAQLLPNPAGTMAPR